MVSRRKFLAMALAAGAALALPKQIFAQAPTLHYHGRVTPAERKAAAAARATSGQQAAPMAVPAMDPGGVPHYFGPYANYANSPLPPIVTFSAPDNANGRPATAVASVVGGEIKSLTMMDAGSGYTGLVTPTVDFTTYDGAGATATVAVASTTAGVITGLSLTAGGSGYSTAPSILFVDSTGTSASATATVTAGVVTGITLNNGGTGYSMNTTAVFSGGGGSGAAALVNVNGLNPASLNLTGGGSGYAGMRKFVDSLPGLTAAGVNNLGQYMPVATPDHTSYPAIAPNTNAFVPNGLPASDYYEIALVEYTEQMHSDLKPTTIRGYVQLGTTVVPGTVPLYQTDGITPITINGVQVMGVDKPHYMGPVIVTQMNTPVRIKFYNLLPTGTGGDLFIPVDPTVMGAGMGALGVGNGTMDMPEMFKENRATLHLHGGLNPWISDGTPHQWTTPAGENTSYPKGVSVGYVPDMDANDNTPGVLSFYYTNGQSARLQFYHDHAYGITRLNVYAGEAAGYLIRDDVEKAMMGVTIPDDAHEIPLVIQDRTWIPGPNQLAYEDPTWPKALDYTKSNFWFDHVYVPNQNPYDMSGANAFGRWDYGPWFWPPERNLNHLEQINPYAGQAIPGSTMVEPPMIPGFPSVSMCMEAFMDTPIVNGTAYPYIDVDPTAYRFRILNACDDRWLNLQLYVAKSSAAMWNLDGPNGAPGTLKDPNAGEVNMVPAVPDAGLPDSWPTDGRDGGVPDPLAVGPSWYQIGTEGGFLPNVAVVPPTPVGYEYNRKNIVVLNITNKSLLLGGAERADVVVDFAPYAGKTVILYNDAPCANPAFDPRLDYYTGNPDQSGLFDPANNCGGAPSTQPGYGPNTRTIMQIRVRGIPSAGTSLANLALTAAGAGYSGPLAVNFSAGNAVASATGSVDAVSFVTAGAGYHTPLVTFADGSTTATGTATGSIDGFVIADGGSGYVTPVVTITDAAGPATATADATLDVNGTITGFTNITGSSNFVTPIVTITDTAVGAPITAASVTATMSITAVTVIGGGSGYATAPSVTISDTGGTPGTPAVATSTLKITGIALTTAGSGYSAAPTFTVADTNPGTGTGGAGTATLSAAGAFNLNALKAALPLAYAQIQPRPIIPGSAYDAAFGGPFPVDPYIRIQDNSTSIMNGELAAINLTAPNFGGSGYSANPVVQITGGNGANAAASAAISGANLTAINVLKGGSGYTIAPLVQITGGGNFVSTPATATANLTNAVGSITNLNGGSGYTTIPTVTLRTRNGQTGSGATAVATVSGGRVTSVTVTNGGSNYSAAPTVQFSYGNASATAVLTKVVGSITLTNPGFGYTASPTVNIVTQTGNTGSGATAAAAFKPGVVSTITLTNAGTGYVNIPTVTITPALNSASPSLAANAAATLKSVTLDFEPKAIQELFELDYGRMNATLGVELPKTTNIMQTTLPYGYIDPPTELLSPSILASPVGSAGDNTQIWKITHNGVDTHAVHIHLTNYQLINRVGWDGAIRPPADNEVGWKETLVMNPLEDCIVAVRAERPPVPWELPNSVRSLDVTMPDGMTDPRAWLNVDPTNEPAIVTNAPVNFGWEYVWHCHLLSHEEMDFMRGMIFAVPPQAPSGLSAVMSSGRVVLSFKDNSISETGFTIYRSIAATGPFVPIVQLPPSAGKGLTVSYTDRTVAKKTTYFYYVVANNLVGYTQTYAAPTAGYPNWSADSAKSNGITINTSSTTPGTPFTPPASLVTLSTPNQPQLGISNLYIFADSFNAGLAPWSGSVGQVRVDDAAAMGSAHAGMVAYVGAASTPSQAQLSAMGSAANAAYVYDLTADAEEAYNASFYFNPNNPDLGDSQVNIFVGIDQSGQNLFGVQYYSGMLRGWVIRNGDFAYTSSALIDSTPHKVEIAWQAGDTAAFSLFLDDKLVGTAKGDTTTLLNEVLLGPSSGVQAGSSASMYFTEFTSNRINAVQFPTFLPNVSNLSSEHE